MKALLKTGFFLVLISFFTLSVPAQNAPKEKKEMSAEEMAEKQTERIAADLDLNADQKAKIKAIKLKYNEQVKAKAQASGEKKRAMQKKIKAEREEMKAIREAQDKEIKSVLTPEQYEKWQAKQKDNKKENRKLDDRKKKDGRRGEVKRSRNK